MARRAVTGGRAEAALRPQPASAEAVGRPSRRAQGVLAAAFVLPALVLYAVFMLYPFAGSIYLSLTDWNGSSAAKDFVGLANYVDLLTDNRMWKAFSHNLVWVALGTLSPIVIGFVLALLLWSGARFVLPLRTLFFVPYVLPSVVIAVVWGWIYNPLFGPLNLALERFGFESLARGWLGDPKTALVAVLIAAIWGTFGFVVVVLLAALQNVDTDLIDAAVIDRANWFRRARHVILPEIAGPLTMVTAVTLIGGFTVFDIVFVMTGGGPGLATEVLGTYTYKMAFGRNAVGYGAALSMLKTIVPLVSSILFVRLRDRRYG